MGWVTTKSLINSTAFGVFLLVGIAGCGPSDGDYKGLTTALEPVMFSLEDDDGPWAWDEASGKALLALEPSSDPDLNGVLELNGSMTGFVLNSPNSATIMSLGLGEKGAPLALALSQQPAFEHGPTTMNALIPRDYLWTRLGECSATELAWGFMSLGEKSVHMREVGPPLTLEDMSIGEGTVTAANADSTGEWALDLTQPGRLVISKNGVEFEGWTIPGQLIVLAQPEGLVVAVANPHSHLSVLKASGVYKFLDIRCDASGEMDVGVGHLQVFDREVSLLRINESGDRSREQGILGFYEPVGSGFGIVAEGEGNDSDGTTYFALADDFGLIFSFGNTQRVGLAVRLGLAGLEP